MILKILPKLNVILKKKINMVNLFNKILLNILLNQEKNCFIIGERKFQEYILDGYCIIKNDGEFTRANNVEISSFNNEKCLFVINGDS